MDGSTGQSKDWIEIMLVDKLVKLSGAEEKNVDHEICEKIELKEIVNENARVIRILIELIRTPRSLIALTGRKTLR